MLDTETWAWRQLRSPTGGAGAGAGGGGAAAVGAIAPRDFGTAARIDDNRIVLFGGYDGRGGTPGCQLVYMDHTGRLAVINRTVC